jgi:hypothetical protein
VDSVGLHPPKCEFKKKLFTYSILDKMVVIHISDGETRNACTLSWEDFMESGNIVEN